MYKGHTSLEVECSLLRGAWTFFFLSLVQQNVAETVVVTTEPEAALLTSSWGGVCRAEDEVPSGSHVAPVYIRWVVISLPFFILCVFLFPSYLHHRFISLRCIIVYSVNFWNCHSFSFYKNSYHISRPSSRVCGPCSLLTIIEPETGCFVMEMFLWKENSHRDQIWVYHSNLGLGTVLPLYIYIYIYRKSHHSDKVTVPYKYLNLKIQLYISHGRRRDHYNVYRHMVVLIKIILK